MSREHISKGRRFDVFRRDGFTCQYCGRQPPEVVLHLDHIIPVIEGGDSDPLNLVTACQDCNLGKGRKLLDKPQRPDADLAWLEMQQETAELRAYQAAKQERDALIAEVVTGLQDAWFEYTSLQWGPNDHVLMQMLAKYEPDVIEEALINVAIKVDGGYLSKGNWLRYTWGILRK
jgi:hypothetical protein